MLNFQKCFEQAVRTIVQQGGPAIEPRPDCVYGIACRFRAKQEDGTVRRCAAGALLPDQNYNPRMETASVQMIAHEFAPEYGGYEGTDAENQFLRKLVHELHDSWAIRRPAVAFNADDFKTYAERLGKAWALDTGFIQSIH